MADSSHTVTTIYGDDKTGPVRCIAETTLRGVVVVKGEGASHEEAYVDAMRQAVECIDATRKERDCVKRQVLLLTAENGRLAETLAAERLVHERTLREYEQTKQQCRFVSSLLGNYSKTIDAIKDKIVVFGEPPHSADTSTPQLRPIASSEFAKHSLILLLGPTSDDKVVTAANIARVIADESTTLTVNYNLYTSRIFRQVEAHPDVEGRDFGYTDYVPTPSHEDGCRGLLLCDTSMLMRGQSDHHAERIKNAKREGVIVLRTATRFNRLYESFADVSFERKQRPVMVVLTRGAGEKLLTEVYCQCELGRFFGSFGVFRNSYETSIKEPNTCFVFADNADGPSVHYFAHVDTGTIVHEATSSSSCSSS